MGGHKCKQSTHRKAQYSEMACRSKDDNTWATAEAGFFHISETCQFYIDVVISRARRVGGGSAMQVSE